jgi:DNA-binding SARP family transcriptional activator
LAKPWRADSSIVPASRPAREVRWGATRIDAVAKARTAPSKSPLRLYLTGRVMAERDGHVVDETRLPGRQGPLALAYLALERARPVPIDELGDAVWGDSLPRAWETALSAIVSKLRAALGALGLKITTASGRYHLALPGDGWIDVEAARVALDEAEGFVARGRARAAWGPANVAASITTRPLLAGVDLEWVARARAGLLSLRVRALSCLASAALANSEWPLAAQFARSQVELEPFRESGWQQLMRALATAGNRAEALRVYAGCRDLLARELGIAPSPETEAIARALRATR